MSKNVLCPSKEDEKLLSNLHVLQLVEPKAPINTGCSVNCLCLDHLSVFLFFLCLRVCLHSIITESRHLKIKGADN